MAKWRTETIKTIVRTVQSVQSRQVLTIKLCHFVRSASLCVISVRQFVIYMWKRIFIFYLHWQRHCLPKRLFSYLSFLVIGCEYKRKWLCFFIFESWPCATWPWPDLCLRPSHGYSSTLLWLSKDHPERKKNIYKALFDLSRRHSKKE